MLEIDGPPMAWFEYDSGEKILYTTYGLSAKNAGELIDAVALHLNTLRNVVIVWRRRPEFSFDEEEKLWKVTYRLATITPPTMGVIPPEKPEGQPVFQLV